MINVTGIRSLWLRTHEGMGLHLEDYSWHRGHLHVRSRGGRKQLLPMPIDVDAAVAAYLQQGRSTTKDRHVFLRSLAPIRRLTPPSDAIDTIVRQTLQRAQIDAPSRSSRQFRHALAVLMRFLQTL